MYYDPEFLSVINVDMVDRLFNKDEQVLAWFPETTSFYPAYVVNGPKKRQDDLYELQFSDDEDGTISYHTIISLLLPFSNLVYVVHRYW